MDNNPLSFRSFEQNTDLQKRVPTEQPDLIEKMQIDGEDYICCSDMGLSGSIAAAFGVRQKDDKHWVPAGRYDELVKLMEEIEQDLKKEATLYHNRVYTVVPKDLDLNLGIMPEDQGFSKKYVFIWDNYRYLNIFPETEWKKLMIQLPEEAKLTMLTRLTGAAFALPKIPNTWEIKEQPVEPQYAE